MDWLARGKRLTAVGGGLLGTFLLAFASPGTPEEVGNRPATPQVTQSTAHRPIRILFPLGQTSLLSGNVQVVAKGECPPLVVDGKPQDWERFDDPVHTTRLRLEPGSHRLELGDEVRSFFVCRMPDGCDAPPHWPILRRHPRNEDDDDRCAACHRTTRSNGLVRVGELKTYKACFECHRREEFDAIHQHPLEPLQHCQNCHALHGSVESSLLKAPREQLCGACHEPQAN